MPTKTISLADFCRIWNLPKSTAQNLTKRGADLDNALSVMEALRASSRKPDSWRTFFESSEADSKEFWQKRKVQEEVRRLELANALVEGEQFLREDVDAANFQLGSAFKMALMEAQSQLPPQLAGLDEAGVEKVLTAEFRRILGNMSDLSSALWTKIREKYERGETDAQYAAVQVDTKSAPKGKRKPK